ncbi:hypothetical protein PRUPE_8G036500 [Prunus persica]|uniref:Uncharacterized protein n=1 Tax=Prunus persica TaxID=3760 RepID=A0A251MSF7_PRUPE|nr:hypothetical protein PRUPE_8G036500 [Prunus persica]
MSESAFIGSIARLMIGWIRNRGGGGLSRTLSSLNGYFSPFSPRPCLEFAWAAALSPTFHLTQTRDLTLLLTMVEPGISLLPFTMVYWSGWPRLGVLRNSFGGT